jgi:predicted RNase H-like HicB family nuclease
MALGDMAVVQCNRWSPLRPLSGRSGSPPKPATVTPDEYWATREGRAYLSDVRAWEDARREETDVAAVTEAAILDAQVEYELGRCRIRTAVDGSREYQASCPEIAPNVAVGVTQQEAQELITEILRPYVRSRIVDGGPLPSDMFTKEHKK